MVNQGCEIKDWALTTCARAAFSSDTTLTQRVRRPPLCPSLCREIVGLLRLEFVCRKVLSHLAAACFLLFKMARGTVLVASVLLTASVKCFAAPNTKNNFTNSKVCPDGKFYDHGTELCEPCIVICKNDHIMNMVEQCQSLCLATYAQLNNKQERPEVSALSQGAAKDQFSSTPSTSSDNMAVLAGVISGVAVVVVFLVILGAYMCKRVQENPDHIGSRPEARNSSSADQGLNPSRQGYQPAGVQENGEQRQTKQPSQSRGMVSYCDPRQWFSAVPTEETVSVQEGPQETALLGNSQGSVVQDFQRLNTVVVATPIYKPSGSMRSTRI